MGGMHCDGKAQGDVLTEVVTLEDDAGPVTEAFGGQTVAVGIDGRDAPTVAVAHLIGCLA
jgi:hypothetical protein